MFQRVCYLIYFIAFTCFVWSGVVRQGFVIYRSPDTASLLVSMGMLVYSIGYAYPATCSSYSITVHLPTLLSQLDEYRTHNGEFNNIKTLRRFHIICLLGYVFGVLTVALVMSSCLLVYVVWINISDLFYPFTTDTFTNSIVTFVYFFLSAHAATSIPFTQVILYTSICCIVQGEINDLNRAFVYFFLSAHAATSIPFTQVILYTSICCIVQGEINDLNRVLMEIAKNSNERLPIPAKDLTSKQTEGQDVTFIPTLNLKSSTNRPNCSPLKLDRTLEDIRLRYENLLDIIAKANDVLQHLFFSILASSIPVSCLILYGIVTLDSNRPQMIYTGLTNLQVFNLLFVILLIGTYIANKVKQPVEYAMKINNTNLSTKASSTIQLMSVRYLTPCLGFNVYGLFSLDSSTLLTVIGTLITYAVVIYQFASTSSSNCQCFNTTES